MLINFTYKRLAVITLLLLNFFGEKFMSLLSGTMPDAILLRA